MKIVMSLIALICVTSTSIAELRMSAIFSDHMVLQQKAPIHVWGWTAGGQEITIEFDGIKTTDRAGADGRFDIVLPAHDAGGPFTLKVIADETKEFTDVLVGEVWVCSGQSNMQWAVQQSDDPDLEALTANYPQIRLVSLPQVGTQETQTTFNGAWTTCTPETVKDFSAVGYFFGRQLHQTLNVPVGLIDNAWGGSSCEAWIRRELMEGPEIYQPLMERWKQTEATYDYEAEMKKYEAARAEWEKTKQGNRPNPPQNQLKNQHRPGNLYNGMIQPILGYTIRGAIWYQGESNASRAYQYREMFPLMIQNWRDDWKQGDFPFYWVQLADFTAEDVEPTGSNWAELREAQTMTMSRLPKTGEAVIIDIGEGRDIHPRNKQDVAKRLARWALANEYGISVPFQSPTYKSHTVEGNKIVVKFDHAGPTLYSFDKDEVVGFQIAGEDQKFVWARGKITGNDTVEVSAESVSSPVAVRYAWSNNPVCNLYSRNGLPANPFRTDDWKGVTADAR
ncbi:MAG: sialate O-acetylesterase [Planctomyces sp.]|nr:sialate O-acetylesterase [Planctomyces sp.]